MGTIVLGVFVVVAALAWLAALVASGFSLLVLCPGLLALLFVTGSET